VVKIAKNDLKQKLIVVLVIAVLVSVVFMYKNQPKCDTVDSVSTSIFIKTGNRMHIGFNLDRESLTFGTVSPDGISKRSMYANYTNDATVTVWVEGDIAPYVLIRPQEFDITPGKIEEVQFTANMPEDIEDGNYTGRVIYCYKDK
jgi:hypothetical protein